MDVTYIVNWIIAMNKQLKKLVYLVLLTTSSLAYSDNSFNLLLMPDSHDCHHTGIEGTLSNNSRIGLLAVANCESDRPTYGKTNANVNNNFSRILIPWTYSRGIWSDGIFMKMLFGLEKDEFVSTANSSADVTFIDITAQFGYQWFWKNGLNVSASIGAAFLTAHNAKTNIDQNETQEIIDFLDKNTTTNQHFASGIILGWAF